MPDTRRPALVALAAAAFLFARPVAATSLPSVENGEISAFDKRIAELPVLVNGGGNPAAFFAPSFLEVIPDGSFRALCRDVVVQNGAIMSVGRVVLHAPGAATVELLTATTTITVDLVIDTAGTGQAIGFRFTGFERLSDSFSDVSRDFSKLPGRASFVVRRLDAEDSTTVIASLDSDRQMAQASGFKLYVLATLADEVISGKRRWSDVVPLGKPSLPASIVRDWPEGTPMTLQTLATLMISASDNRATDTLIATLGQDAIRAQVIASGHRAPDRLLPLLSITQAFALKMPGRSALREAYAEGNDAQQSTFLERHAADLEASDVDPGNLSTVPRFIEDIEWFASANDMVGLLNSLHRVSDPVVLQILSIDRGAAPADAGRWRYLGYKGGSEPGVIAMNFVGQTRQGHWVGVSASWNDPAAAVDKATMTALTTRILNLAVRE